MSIAFPNALLNHFFTNLLLLLGSRRNKSSRATFVIDLNIIFGAFSVLIYVGIEIPMLSPPRNHFCSIYHRVKIVSFAAALFCGYFALWFRVFSVFYRNKIMKKSMSKVLQYVNISVLPLLLIVVSSNLALFLSAPAYTYAGCGCKAVQAQTNNAVKWAILAVCTIVFQVVLVFSFIYPLRLHRKKMLNRGFDHRSSIPIVKRAAVVAVVCVVSDLLNFAFAAIYKGTTVYANHIAFSCNLLINLIGAILSFANWRKKLFPCNSKKKASVSEQATKHNYHSYSHTSGSTNLTTHTKFASNIGNDSNDTAL